MLSSKDILERTGISRATLNNYISAGLVARPEVLPPGPQDGGAPRIGYFPDDTIERIETIQRLKREGWSLGRILQFFGERPPGELPATGDEAPAAVSGLSPSPAPSAAAPISAAALTTGVSRAPTLRPDTPQVMVIAVLAVTLHDADTLWVALSVHDYFALTNEISGEIRRIIASRGGEVMRVAPHRFVCRFLPRPQAHHLWSALEAAEAVREAVREVSGRWKLRRSWDWDIFANAGLCEGESWVSTPPQEDVQIVGETLDDAQEMGYRLVILPSLLFGTVMGACDQALKELREQRRPPNSTLALPVAERFRRFGADEWNAVRTRFRDVPQEAVSS